MHQADLDELESGLQQAIEDDDEEEEDFGPVPLSTSDLQIPSDAQDKSSPTINLHDTGASLPDLRLQTDGT